jgi:UDP-glucose 4-epimerase
LITWVIGSGGLLGSAIQRKLARPFIAAPIPWNDAEAVSRELTRQLQRFVEAAGSEPWAIIWAAGAATVSASRDDTAIELQVFEEFLSALRIGAPRGEGVFFLSSSAGGVFAGSAEPPFTRSSPAKSLSAYGDLKLAQEELTRAQLIDVCSVVIGRFSNIYGPGQNLDKLQGLISKLALATASRQPVNIFVSLDTMRDYIFVDDAARAALAWVDFAARTRSAPVNAVIASGEPAVLGQLIRLMQDVARTKVPVALGAHSSSSAQVLDLRMLPTPIPGMPSPEVVSLPAGMKLVYLDILQRSQLLGSL